MFLQRTVSVIFLSSTFILSIGCVHDAKNFPVSQTAQATAQLGGSEYIVVEFEKGSSALNRIDREKLNRLNQNSNKAGREINEITVLAWADREYPQEGTEATRQDIALAEQRADSIKKFLKEDLQTKADVDNLNMAERPGIFSEMMKNESYKTKTAFEETGAAPNESQLLGSKSSKAVIFIKHSN
jgi:hypothetical protein